MGSSEGGGYANCDGNLMGWINELCYIRLDLNPNAPTDPWTKGTHTGISHMYLGQRGATKLAAKAGVKVPENYVYPHPDMCTIKHEDHAQCLKLIQKAMQDPQQEPHVRKLYETVGVYLGYALAQYNEFYKIEHVMILGRVSKGAGGDLMLATAQKVLETEFPEIPKITFHTADDHFKAVGQCIAAAALPVIRGEPVYYSATDPSKPMSMVTAEQVAQAVVMPAELLPIYVPGGVPDGFTPMFVGELPQLDGVSHKETNGKEGKSKKSKKKVKVVSKKKKACC
jgi:hypothetical protein